MSHEPFVSEQRRQMQRRRSRASIAVFTSLIVLALVAITIVQHPWRQHGDNHQPQLPARIDQVINDKVTDPDPDDEFGLTPAERATLTNMTWRQVIDTTGNDGLLASSYSTMTDDSAQRFQDLVLREQVADGRQACRALGAHVPDHEYDQSRLSGWKAIQVQWRWSRSTCLAATHHVADLLMGPNDSQDPAIVTDLGTMSSNPDALGQTISTGTLQRADAMSVVTPTLWMAATQRGQGCTWTLTSPHGGVMRHGSSGWAPSGAPVDLAGAPAGAGLVVSDGCGQLTPATPLSHDKRFETAVENYLDKAVR